ncbi:hypothetical protein E2C01_012793 [Portunus trituberculatus]|uniref:Myb-like domain-containing protein n=1 Tax=Portunus trituberculatus TaxID=210409 RepID=A0A5B7DF29_PORTR|nr:hypothetical protein [Portunus trituberculatus]
MDYYLQLARILAEIVEASSHEANLDKCCTALSDHLNHLKLIAEYGNVQWTEKNLITMLRIIIEWKLLCHDSVEVEVMLGNRQPLWREVASSISDHYKLDPAKCYARFSQLCREYKSVMTFNARLGKTDGAKSVVCQDLLDCIMSLDVFHDAQLDLRDRWWASDKSRSWGQDETLDLIFTVREMWTGSSKVNWDVVSEMMAASGYKHTGESCQQRFQCLFKSYQAAVEHNQHCNIRTRRRPPFYYKLRDLFGTCDMNSTFVTEHNTIVQEDMNLGDLWQKNPKPVVAYGLHALPLPGWEKACKWKVNELYLLIEAAVDFVLQQPGLEQKGKTVETVASKLLNVHGYEKTPEQCREQWQYIVTTFLRGGYLQFKEQLNLIHILAPSLLVSLTNNAHISMSMATSHQQQQIAHRADCKTTMSSATEIKDTAMIHSSKKRKVGSHHCSRLPSKEATNDGDETSASENITSFVQINVPSNKSVRKRRTQASISERKREGRSVPYCTEKGIDISADSKNGHSVLRSVKRSSCTSKEKSSKATVNTKRASTSSTDAKLTDSKPSSEKTNSLKAPKDKVQVEVLSITENKTSKLIECRTVEGASPTQSLKLYYPADHPLPPNVRYLYIPQAMFHSNCGSPIGKDPLPNYLEDNSVKASYGINVKQEINCEGDETNEELDRLSEPNDVATFTINPEKEAVLGLLSKYNQHCKHGKERLHDVIQEYHRDHISALKKMTSLFKELQECV